MTHHAPPTTLDGREHEMLTIASASSRINELRYERDRALERGDNMANAYDRVHAENRHLIQQIQRLREQLSTVRQQRDDAVSRLVHACDERDQLIAKIEHVHRHAARDAS